MTETRITGLKSGHQKITPTCRSNRGQSQAFDEAVDRLRSAYDRYAGADGNSGVTWHLVLVRDEGAE